MAGARPLTLDEQARWLSAAKCQRDRTLFVLGLASGLRCSELLALRVRHVWSGQGPCDSLVLERRYQKHGRGKYRRAVSTRVLPLHRIARAAVQSLIDHLFPAGTEVDPHVYLFASNRGRNRPLTRRHVQNIIRDTAFAAGIDLSRVSTHSLRKTLAASVYEHSGHDLLVTREVLQHRSIETTWRYLDLAAEKARSIILQIDLPGEPGEAVFDGGARATA